MFGSQRSLYFAVGDILRMAESFHIVLRHFSSACRSLFRTLSYLDMFSAGSPQRLEQQRLSLKWMSLPEPAGWLAG